MQKKNIITLCFMMILSGCSSSTASSITSASLNTDSISSVRVSNGYLEYQDANGNWQQIIAVDELKGEDGKDGQDGKDGINGKNGTNGTNGTNGIDGVNGKDGINGTNGSNGKDGTIVTVNDDGYLVLDGTVTTWKLNSDNSTSSYSIDENGNVLLNGEKTGWKLTKSDIGSITQLSAPTITYCEQISNTQIGIKWDASSIEAVGAAYINGISRYYSSPGESTEKNTTATIPANITSGEITVGLKLLSRNATYSDSEIVTTTINVNVNRYPAPTNIQMTENNGTYKFTWDCDYPVFAKIYKSSTDNTYSSVYTTSHWNDNNELVYYFEYTPTIQWYEDEGDVEYTLEPGVRHLHI